MATECHLPVLMPGVSGVISLGAGPYSTVVLEQHGAVWGLGDNTHGQLGDGSSVKRTTPVQATGLAGVIALGASQAHSLAVTTGPVAAQLLFRTQPGASTGGTLATQPVIEIRGTDGSLMTGIKNAPVTIFVKPGTGASGSYLTGTTTINCVNGVATFSGIGLSQRGKGYVLRAAFAGLPPVDSEPFDVGGAPYGWSDVVRALRISSGLGAALSWDIANLNPVAPAYAVDLLDPVRIARKVAGLESNP